MSTRAIIGKKLADGKIKGICVWNDGFPNILGSLIRRTVKTEADLDKLLEIKSCSSLMSKKGMKEFAELSEKKFGITSEFNQVFSNLFAYEQNDNYVASENGTYKSVEECLGQDLNYVYIFDPVTNKWKTYK